MKNSKTGNKHSNGVNCTWVALGESPECVRTVFARFESVLGKVGFLCIRIGKMNNSNAGTKHSNGVNCTWVALGESPECVRTVFARFESVLGKVGFLCIRIGKMKNLKTGNKHSNGVNCIQGPSSESPECVRTVFARFESVLGKVGFLCIRIGKMKNLKTGNKHSNGVNCIQGPSSESPECVRTVFARFESVLGKVGFLCIRIGKMKNLKTGNKHSNGVNCIQGPSSESPECVRTVFARFESVLGKVGFLCIRIGKMKNLKTGNKHSNGVNCIQGPSSESPECVRTVFARFESVLGKVGFLCIRIGKMKNSKTGNKHSNGVNCIQGPSGESPECVRTVFARFESVLGKVGLLCIRIGKMKNLKTGNKHSNGVNCIQGPSSESPECVRTVFARFESVLGKVGFLCIRIGKMKNLKTGNKHSNGVNCIQGPSSESPECVRTVFARFESVLGKVGFLCIRIGKMKNSKTGNKHSNGVNCIQGPSGESPECVRTVFARFESVLGKVGLLCIRIGKMKNLKTGNKHSNGVNCIQGPSSESPECVRTVFARFESVLGKVGFLCIRIGKMKNLKTGNKHSNGVNCIQGPSSESPECVRTVFARFESVLGKVGFLCIRIGKMKNLKTGNKHSNGVNCIQGPSSESPECVRTVFARFESVLGKVGFLCIRIGKMKNSKTGNKHSNGVNCIQGPSGESPECVRTVFARFESVLGKVGLLCIRIGKMKNLKTGNKHSNGVNCIQGPSSESPECVRTVFARFESVLGKVGFLCIRIGKMKNLKTGNKHSNGVNCIQGPSSESPECVRTVFARFESVLGKVGFLCIRIGKMKNSKTGNKHSNGVNCIQGPSGESPECVRTVFARFESVLGKVGLLCIRIGKMKNSKTGNKHSNGVNCIQGPSGESPECVRTVFARFESVLGKVGLLCIRIGKMKNSKTGNKHSNGVNCIQGPSSESPECVRTVFARFESVLGKVGFLCIRIGKMKNSKTGNKHSNGVNCIQGPSGESPECVRTVFARFESVLGKVGFLCIRIG